MSAREPQRPRIAAHGRRLACWGVRLGLLFAVTASSGAAASEGARTIAEGREGDIVALVGAAWRTPPAPIRRTLGAKVEKTWVRYRFALDSGEAELRLYHRDEAPGSPDVFRAPGGAAAIQLLCGTCPVEARDALSKLAERILRAHEQLTTPLWREPLPEDPAPQPPIPGMAGEPAPGPPLPPFAPSVPVVALLVLALARARTRVAAAGAFFEGIASAAFAVVLLASLPQKGAAPPPSEAATALATLWLALACAALTIRLRAGRLRLVTLAFVAMALAAASYLVADEVGTRALVERLLTLLSSGGFLFPAGCFLFLALLRRGLSR